VQLHAIVGGERDHKGCRTRARSDDGVAHAGPDPLVYERRSKCCLYGHR
jgi:hypothetical protein